MIACQFFQCNPPKSSMEAFSLSGFNVAIGVDVNTMFRGCLSINVNLSSRYHCDTFVDLRENWKKKIKFCCELSFLYS